jgi:hypothetical protein
LPESGRDSSVPLPSLARDLFVILKLDSRGKLQNDRRKREERERRKEREEREMVLTSGPHYHMASTSAKLPTKTARW